MEAMEDMVMEVMVAMEVMGIMANVLLTHLPWLILAMDMEAMVDTAMAAMEDMEDMVIMGMVSVLLTQLPWLILATVMEVMEAMADMVMAATVDMEVMVIMVTANVQQLLAMAMEDMEAMADMVMVVMEDMEDMAIMVMARDLLSLAMDIMVGMEDTEVTAMEAMVMAMAMANESMSPFDAATTLQKLDKKVNLQIMCDECFRRNTSSTKFAWSDLIHSESLFSHFPKILRLCFILASVERVTYDLQIQRHKR